MTGILWFTVGRDSVEPWLNPHEIQSGLDGVSPCRGLDSVLSKCDCCLYNKCLIAMATIEILGWKEDYAGFTGWDDHARSELKKRLRHAIKASPSEIRGLTR